MMRFRLFLSILAVIFFLALPGGNAGGEESSPPPEISRDFNISAIVLCDPADPLCRPTFFFHAGKNIRINVLENFSTSLVGSTREVKLFFYNPDNEEILKAGKYEQFIWGPHVNDKFLCFLPDSLDNGLYVVKIIVKVGFKEYQKSLSFSVKNSRAAADEPAGAREK
jgi:hypothetical protein